MEIADDIAYGVHNLEDAIALRLVTRDEWKTLEPSFDTTWAIQLTLLSIRAE
jgi:dGTPase